MDRDELLAALRDHRLDAVLGIAESEWLDFKASHYDLGNRWHTSELAKDVSALANVSGGLIVVGVRTERPPDSDREQGAELRLLPRNIVSEQRYRDTIKSHVYPSVLGLEVYSRRPDPVLDGGDVRGLEWRQCCGVPVRVHPDRVDTDADGYGWLTRCG